MMRSSQGGEPGPGLCWGKLRPNPRMPLSREPQELGLEPNVLETHCESQLLVWCASDSLGSARPLPQLTCESSGGMDVCFPRMPQVGRQASRKCDWPKATQQISMSQKETHSEA